MEKLARIDDVRRAWFAEEPWVMMRNGESPIKKWLSNG